MAFTKKEICFSILALVLFLFVIESAARAYEFFNPLVEVDSGGGFNVESRVFVPDRDDPNYLVLNPQKQILASQQRFKRLADPDVFRIVFLGESSVWYLQSLLPDFENRIKPKLPPQFSRVEIINAGIGSYGSQRLSIVANEMLAYKPDLVLIYMGHNEFEELEQFSIVKPEYRSFTNFIRYSAVIRVMTDFFVKQDVKILEKKKLEDLISKSPNTRSAWSHNYTEEDVAERMLAFDKNLRYIIRLFKDANIPVIIGSIPSNLLSVVPKEVYLKAVADKKTADLKAAAEFSLRTMLGRHQSSPIENKIIQNAAQELQIPLADVKLEIEKNEPNGIPGETLFSDHCHLNAEGNKILLDVFLKMITFQ